jgi:triosephosphate isomerase
MRRPFIGGNWKMFLDAAEGKKLAEELADSTKDVKDRDIMICPAFPLLQEVSRAIKGSGMFVGAQNMYYENEGAFTGEVSARMLQSVGCTHVIIGHSERRHVFHEKNDLIHRKVAAALQAGLKPVLCVGELLDEREAGKTETVVREQVDEGLKGVAAEELENIVIAYEPVWAIGTGKTATPEDADSVHSFIRTLVADLYGERVSESLRIIYGGSVKPANVDGLMAMENIDGALVGGASLESESFTRIIKYQT